MTRVLRSADSRLWILAMVVVLASSGANAQTFYKWTDEHGIVHFSDAPPPPQTHDVEERKLPRPPQSAIVESPGAAAAEGASGDAKAAEATPAVGAVSGPARVVIVSRKTPRTGPSAMHVIGEVKNVGGADAQRVVVTVSAADPSQGTPCLTQEVAVAPPTLHPGENGKFATDVDSPCLNGEPAIDVAPGWE